MKLSSIYSRQEPAGVKYWVYIKFNLTHTLGFVDYYSFVRILIIIRVTALTATLIVGVLQVNEKFLELKRDIYIGIVEKAQETSSDSDMHNAVLLPLLYFMNSGCVLECRETPTSWVTI